MDNRAGVVTQSAPARNDSKAETAMEGKFSYFDIVAYLIPGIAVVFVVTYLARAYSLNLPSGSGNDVVDVTGFLAIAYIVGHLVQAIARERFSGPSRSADSRVARLLGAGRVFREGMPSELALCSHDGEGSKVLDRRIMSRAKIEKSIRALEGAGLLQDDVTAKLLAGEAAQDCGRASHDAYRTLYSMATARGLAAKADRANEAYNFFRGMSQTALVLGVMLVASAATGLLALAPWPSWRTVALSAPQAGANLGLGLAALLAAEVFVSRAVGAGANHVREVFELASELVATLGEGDA